MLTPCLDPNYSKWVYDISVGVAMACVPDILCQSVL